MVDKDLVWPVKLMVTVTFIIMILMNTLANTLPINGQQTGQVSDYYSNLFAPAGFTFAIWGIIYLLLIFYTLYQIGFFRMKISLEKVFEEEITNEKDKLFIEIGIFFSLSNVANTFWILCWHYHKIIATMVLILIMLISLIMINRKISKHSLSIKEKFFISLPFSVYFGWITVATIANATTLLVSLGWNGFNLEESFWTVIILVIGMLIGIATMIVQRDIPYGLVLIWAYFGIRMKHTSSAGFAGDYQEIIMTTAICIGLFVVTECYLIVKKLKLPLKK